MGCVYIYNWSRLPLGPGSGLSRQSAGPCSESGASGGVLAGWGGGGRGEKRKEAPGASETQKKRVRPGTWQKRVTNTPPFTHFKIRATRHCLTAQEGRKKRVRAPRAEGARWKRGNNDEGYVAFSADVLIRHHDGHLNLTTDEPGSCKQPPH